MDSTTFLCFGVFLFVIYKFIWRWATFAKRKESNHVDSCESVSCVRCKAYDRILEISAIRYKESHLTHTPSKRVKRAVTERCISRNPIPDDWLSDGQHPNVFMIPGLRALPWHYIREFGRALDVVQSSEMIDVLRKEFQELVFHSSSLWQTNRTPSGQWKVCHLVNQGQQVEQTSAICTNSMSMLKRLQPGCCMINNIFGNASFSVVQPGCHISPHSGPTNIRLRCHVPLFVPAKCTLRVHTSQRSWVEGECLIFDDSFEHEVWHHGDDGYGDRVVFMFDMWHPDLALEERAVIDDLFAPDSANRHN